MTEDLNARLRALPGVDRVVAALAGADVHPVVADAAREAVDAARAAVLEGGVAPDLDAVVADARARIDAHGRARLRPVLNATGVLIHTNLGRAPLGRDQLAAVEAIAAGYSNLEYDLGAGRRGSRYSHARSLLATLTGAEDALVVNNNAAAVLLVLSALARGRDVVISRGELIEIGGEFRIPDVMSLSGARLVEVGTTNRTHLGDYERAITESTAAILKVHPSNYRVVGFTKEVAGRDLARLAAGRKVFMIYDLGSGYLGSPHASWAESEPAVEHVLAEGADIVTFSGDKLLGGPQAGVIAGRAAPIARISHHPLLRALRVDKMTLAALQETLLAYLGGRAERLPLWEMALAPAEALEARARALASRLAAELEPAGVKVEAAASESVAGGGSLPGAHLTSWAIALTHPERSVVEIEAALRGGEVPVIGRIDDDRFLLDLRTVRVAEDEQLAALVIAALAPDRS